MHKGINLLLLNGNCETIFLGLQTSSTFGLKRIDSDFVLSRITSVLSPYFVFMFCIARSFMFSTLNSLMARIFPSDLRIKK